MICYTLRLLSRIVTLALVLLSANTWSHAQELSDYRARTIYFLLPDRFHPHQPYSPYIDLEYPDANNIIDCFTDHCTEEPQWRRYWGGDIEGILEKLDYLKRLGISGIWVGPLMENVRAYVAGTGYGTGYHGYWVQNYYRVNAHFGNWEEVNELSLQLHARGMRYMQDITLNHSNPNDNHVYGRLYESSDSDQVFIQSYEDDYDPFSGMRYYKHYQTYPACQEAATKADYEWSYWQLHHCLLADLSGYNQHDSAVADYLLGAGKIWLDNGVDDYRLDAVKFPFPDFIARFTQTMRDHLGSLNRPEPYIVGEWSHGGVGDEKSLKFANSYDVFHTNILDFQLSYALNQFIGGNYEYSTEQLTAAGLDQKLHQRVTAFEGRDTWQGTFIDNHDQIRTMVRLQKLDVDDESERRQRMDLASVLLMTVRGIPIIYYGDEQYLAYYQDGQDTPPQYVNSGDDDPWNRPGLNSWDEQTPAFRIISALAKLRAASPAIWRGEYRTIFANDDVLVFERIDGNDVVLVAVNRGDATTITMPGPIGMMPGQYLGLLNDASDVNRGNYLAVTPSGWTLHLNRLSSLAVRR